MSLAVSPTFTRRADPFRDLLVIDRNAPRFNQLVVALVSLAAVVSGAWPLLALLGVQLAVTVRFGRRFCLPCLIYFRFVQPRVGEGALEDARAPRFANLIGAVFLSSAAVLWAVGLPTAGRVLGGVVAALAGLAVTTGLCVGCEVYRVLARLRGVKGGSFERVDLAELDAQDPAPGTQTIVLFTHPLCADCQDLGSRLALSGSRVITVDVSRRRDLARKYGITLVPLAVRVGADGRVLGPAERIEESPR